MNFSKALELMKQGKSVSRRKWIDKHIYLADNGIIYCVRRNIEFWCDTHEDLLADDWYEYEIGNNLN